MNKKFQTIAAVLFIAFLSANVCGQELTIYVIPPNGTINWSSPRSMFLSYGANLLKKNKYPPHSHPLGHLIVELKDSSHYTITGMVAESRGDINSKVLRDGYGLGILFAPLNGKLREGRDNLDEIEARYTNGEVRFMKFTLSQANFSRLWQYLEEYKQFGYDKIYNGENKPREGKGAGCSAFGTSFIDVAGLLPKDVMNKWVVKANVPGKLIGGPGGNKRWVGLPKILFKGKWAGSSKHNSKTIAYYEPSLIYAWILTEWNKTNNINGSVREIRGSAKGIVIDCTKSAVPADPIWTDKQQPALVTLGHH